jgi:hypothetical protein
MSRRSLLASLPSLGAMHPHVLSALAAGLPQQAFDAQSQQDTEFWTENIRNPEAGASRSLSPNTAPRAVFVYFDPAHGFLAGSDIGDAGLPDRGDTQVLVHVDHIRASAGDQKRFANLEAGSLRIDLQQQTALPSLAERLAWTSIAAVLPQEKSLPPLKEMTFDPGTTWGKMQTVPLPGGGGRWTWNFFLQHRKSRWMQLFDILRTGAGLASQIFGVGLPAIASTALITIDRIVAGLTCEANSEWLFQSSDVYIYSTKEARDTFEGSKLRLKQGMYIVLPSDQLAAFSKQRNNLIVKDGLIVPAGTSSLDVYEAAKEAIPDVTYLTVGVSVKTRQAAK